jgi:branched-chain amino acid transport system substrate-binding protein
MRIFAAKSVIALAASLIAMPISAYGQEPPPLKIGLILPYKGVYAVTAQGIDHGFQVALAEYGGTVAGRPIDIVRADDELTPSVGVQRFNRLVRPDKVDLIAGVVGSNVGIALSELAEKAKKPTIFALRSPMKLPESSATRTIIWLRSLPIASVSSAWDGSSSAARLSAY